MDTGFHFWFWFQSWPDTVLEYIGFVKNYPWLTLYVARELILGHKFSMQVLVELCYVARELILGHKFSMQVLVELYFLSSLWAGIYCP